QDLWLRWIIGCFASVSVFGLGFARRNLVKSSELQMRLVRASELNTHLAQMISRQNNASPDVRGRSKEIIEETDRVTAQLNEFINYSRPREVRRAALVLGSVVSEVVRALNYDIDEKHIQLQVVDEQLAVEADEQLLRQAL